MTASSSPEPSTLPLGQSRTATNDRWQSGSSGSWPGALPDDWDSTRVKRLFHIVNGATPKSTEPSYWDGGIPWATPEDLGDTTAQFLRETRRTLSAAGLRNCGASLVPADSLLLSTRAPIGYVRLAAQPTATNQGCRSLIPQQAVADSRFYYYAFTAARPVLEAYGTGTTFTELSSTELGLVPVPVPPARLQRIIADYLGHWTARIDDLIAKKERLIELLEEKRTALITQAVTKGLDPDVPMKDSGVEWLGEIPEHWDTTSLQHLSPNVTVGIVVTPTKYYQDEGVPCLRSQNVRLARISYDNLVFISNEANVELAKSQIYSGDLVTVRTGEPGTTAVVPDDLDGANCIDLIIVREAELADTRWLCWFMNSEAAHVQYRIWSGGAAQQHLNVGAVKQVRVPTPPRDEQSEIARYLGEKMRRFDGLRNKLREAIEQLKEYRSALITAAVTGKIDVRDHAA